MLTKCPAYFHLSEATSKVLEAETGWTENPVPISVSLRFPVHSSSTNLWVLPSFILQCVAPVSSYFMGLNALNALYLCKSSVFLAMRYYCKDKEGNVSGRKQKKKNTTQKPLKTLENPPHPPKLPSFFNSSTNFTYNKLFWKRLNSHLKAVCLGCF